MLTARQNMYECIKGGNPDRFVNNYEAIQLLFNPLMMHSPSPRPGDMYVKNAWGVYNSFPEGVPGSFPNHDPEHLLIKDIEHWQDYVTVPSTDVASNEEWDMFRAMYDAVDTTKAYKATFYAPGLFEQCHHTMKMEEALVNFYEYPDEMHDFIKTVTEYELKVAELICDKLKPDALFHHDDWGSEKSTFMSVPMFEEFFVDAYKEIYGYYKSHGCELVFHHSDSYAATFVPDMIEMGIDVFQGSMRTNNNPELVKKYGDKITIMGDIDNKLMDFEGWTKEDCKKAAIASMESCGMKGYIPCITQGGPGSVYPGAYAALCEVIDEYNAEKFGCTNPDELRLPHQILF